MGIIPLNTFSRPSLHPASLASAGGIEELATHPRTGRGRAVPTKTEDGSTAGQAGARALSGARAVFRDAAETKSARRLGTRRAQQNDQADD
ncbi:MAG TPA: hypothetical protein VGO11_01115, partial [Chthoniobacteraceae bacterium]|nr:hypothetical protein [Chthoniobacteraceae bacterium]